MKNIINQFTERAKNGLDIKFNLKKLYQGLCCQGHKKPENYLALINNCQFNVTCCVTCYSLSLVENSFLVLLGIYKLKCLASKALWLVAK